MAHNGGGKRLDKSVAIISGALSPIGLAAATRFAEEGAQLALTDESDDSSALEQALKNRGVDYRYYACEPANEKALIKLFKRVQQDFSRVDILVNIADSSAIENNSIMDLTADGLRLQLDVSIKNYMLCCREAIKIMKTQSTGCIINTTSMAYRGSRHQLCQSASNGAIATFTRSLGKSQGKNGIRVNAVAPGVITLDNTAAPKETIDAIPLGRAGTPLDVANCMLFLASDDASFINAQVVEVSGALNV